MIIHEASENYLEAILILNEQDKEVRSVDICNYFGFAKSTISVAMKKLREAKLIQMSDDGYITLTPTGANIAKKIYERHVILAELFMHLGVDKETALADACKIEHDISNETFQALKQHYLQELKNEK